MKLLNKSVICIWGFLSFSSLLSQDILFLKNGDQRKVKVEIVGTTEVQYFNWENLNGPKYVIRKDEVALIKYQSGFEDRFFTNSGNQVEIQDNNSNMNENLSLNLYLNSGSIGNIGDSKLKEDYFLLYNTGTFIDWGIGFKKYQSQRHFYGVNFILGIQGNSVNQYDYYQQLRSTFGSTQIYNYYIDNIMTSVNFGIEANYGIEDASKKHKTNLIIGLKNASVNDFNMSIYLNSGQNIYMRGEHLNSIVFESKIQYEHRIYKKLGIHFNLGFQLFGLNTTWNVSDNNGYYKDYNSHYNVFQIKGGSGFLLY